jgi:hypothetical protein
MMDSMVPGPAARWRVRVLVRRMPGLLLMLCALAGFSVAPVDAWVMFAGDSAVPPSVQEFAWRVIETRCNFQSHERRQRSFWAYDARARRTDAGVVYSINVVSDVAWRKTAPPAFIEMTVVDDGGVRLTGLKASFITCAP